MLIHCPSCLGAAATTQTAEVACGDGMSTMWTAERGQAVLHFDGVMSHIFKCSRFSEQGSEPKFLRREFGLARAARERFDSTSSASFCAGKVTEIACDFLLF